MRVAVFGDVGGHLEPFVRSLHALGVRFDPFYIPEGLTIIQAGDLIHRGDGDNELVLLVDAFLNSPFADQWVQLIGNHELQHTGQGKKFWVCNCQKSTKNTIKRWWNEGQAHVGVTLVGGKHKLLSAEDTVITHAGVTYPFAKIALETIDAKEITQALNRLQAENHPALGSVGVMMNDGGNNPLVGPIWGVGNSEIYPTWVDDPEFPFALIPRFSVTGDKLFSGGMPFNQIHGHTTSFIWDEVRWRASVALYFRKRMNAYRGIRTTRFQPGVDSGAFLGIDPGFETATPQVDEQPFLLVEDVEEVYVGR